MQFINDEREAYWIKFRIYLICAFFLIALVAVTGRVYYLQTVEAQALEDRTAVQRDREVTRQARRGEIRDRNGIEMAVSIEVPSIFANPQRISYPEREARRLAAHLNRTEEELVELLSSERRFVWLQRQAHPSAAEAIRELGIPGVEITTEYKRYYPLRDVAGQLLGFVGIDGDGLEGLERQFNEELAGGTYRLSISRDARGRAMLLSETPEFGKFEGHSLHLTIDEKIQRTTQVALREQVAEHKAKGGYAIVMDVNTGDILALASTPEFDPNRIGDFQSGDWRLRPITDTLEPGSVFKPFLLAAALQEGTTHLDKVYDTRGGVMRIGRYPIRDVSRRDTMTAAEVIQRSGNIGSYEIARELGREKYFDYIRAFGFGTRTGLGLRGEQPGLVWPPDRWAEITFANVSFGQGLTVTPLQMASGISALANGGMLMQPRIVDEIRDRDGNILRREEPVMVRRVISPEAAEQVSWAMSLVTIPGGTGVPGAVEHFTVAGKTGTAQKVDPETRGYDPDGWISGFVGFAPAERAEIAVVVFIDEPNGTTRYGGQVAGPAFRTIMQEALHQRGVMPLPAEERFQLGNKPPEGPRVNAAPPAPDHMVVLPTMRVLQPEARGPRGEDQLPDFRNLTLRQAVDRSRRSGLVPSVEGWGRVVSQNPAPGTPLEEIEEFTLILSSTTRDQLLSREPSQGGLY